MWCCVRSHSYRAGARFVASVSWSSAATLDAPALRAGKQSGHRSFLRNDGDQNFSYRQPAAVPNPPIISALSRHSRRGRARRCAPVRPAHGVAGQFVAEQLGTGQLATAAPVSASSTRARRVGPLAFDACGREHLVPHLTVAPVSASSTRARCGESARARRGQMRSPRAAPDRRRRSRQLGPHGPYQGQARATHATPDRWSRGRQLDLGRPPWRWFEADAGKRDHLVPRPAVGAVADSSGRAAHVESGRGRRGQVGSLRAALVRWRRGRQLGPGGPTRVSSRPTRASETMAIGSGRNQPRTSNAIAQSSWRPSAPLGDHSSHIRAPIFLDLLSTPIRMRSQRKAIFGGVTSLAFVRKLSPPLCHIPQ